MKRPEGSLISYFSNRVKKEGGINLVFHLLVNCCNYLKPMPKINAYINMHRESGILNCWN